MAETQSVATGNGAAALAVPALALLRTAAVV
jgi:hypothetical protein